MIITCPSCSTQFQVDGAKLSPTGTKVRCASCRHVWLQALENQAPESQAPVIPPRPQPAPAAKPAPEIPPHAVQRPAPPQAAPRTEAAREAFSRLPQTPIFSPVDDADGRQARGRPRILMLAGFVVLGVLVGGMLGAGYLFRHEIVKAWPKSAALYELFNLKVNVVGIDFRNVTLIRDTELGAEVIEVRGEIVNITGKDVKVPRLFARMRDSKAKELYHWTFEALTDTLGPKQVSAFSSRVTNPPENIKDVEVTFAARSR